MMTKIFFIFVFILSGTLIFWWSEKTKQPSPLSDTVQETEVSVVAENGMLPVEKEETVKHEALLPAATRITGVPFTVQAPFAEWSNPTFQNACEEASLIMAKSWAFGESLTREGAKKEIEALASFQKKKFGHSVDTSLQDTAWLLNEYFHVFGKVQTSIEKEDIKRALSEERLVIVPTDGRKLKNPNFTQPGPPRHMLVIVGYDDQTNEFITNDPGTRKGESYRYSQDILYDAILDYPTGDHEPITSTDKVMMTVGEDAALP